MGVESVAGGMECVGCVDVGECSRVGVGLEGAKTPHSSPSTSSIVSVKRAMRVQRLWRVYCESEGSGC